MAIVKKVWFMSLEDAASDSDQSEEKEIPLEKTSIRVNMALQRKKY